MLVMYEQKKRTVKALQCEGVRCGERRQIVEARCRRTRLMDSKRWSGTPFATALARTACPCGCGAHWASERAGDAAAGTPRVVGARGARGDAAGAGDVKRRDGGGGAADDESMLMVEELVDEEAARIEEMVEEEMLGTSHSTPDAQQTSSSDGDNGGAAACA